ncbi:hypothetical protein KKB99_07800, partial [bacterium]|nr:hypothetical protein [bacterium]MBU1025895.1 hypothetical protein [bacterium]
NQSVALLDIDSYDDDPGDSISKYEWDFDASNGVNFLDSISSLPNQAHATYQNTTGSDKQFTATLRVTDTHMATDTCEVIITVHTEDINNTNPVAIANANPNPVTSGRPVAFIDILSFDPDDPLDHIVAYRWDTDIFNGVNWEYESDQPNQSSHIYINTGLDPLQFTARLQVEDTHGATNYDDITITVNPNNIPVAVCDAEPNPIRGGLQVHLLDGDSYDPDPAGGIIKFEWDFDYDGVTFDVEFTHTQPDRAYHIYQNSTADPIIFTAAVRVTDTALTTDICEVDITVNPNHPPTAVGYADPDTIYGNTETTLHAEGSYDSDPGDFISKIEWDFEYDGIFASNWSSTNKNDTIAHVYTNDTGSRIQVTAMLRVYDEANVSNDDAVIINVDPPLPIPIITHTENKTTNTIGRQFTFQSFNMNSSLISWTNGPWDFTQANNTGSYTENYVNPATDPDFAPFRATYPTATVVYKVPDTVNGGLALAPRYYQDILLPDIGNQAELGQENTLLGELASMPFDNPVRIPFPMQMGYYEYLVGTGMIADMFQFTMTFTITSRGYGMVKTVEGTYNCLLMRTYTTFNVPGSGMDPQLFVTYEWLSDDGTKIATATTSQFDDTTYEPIGMIKGAQLLYKN